MPEASTPKNVANGSTRRGQAFKDKEKPTEVRMTNITAAKGILLHVYEKVSYVLSEANCWFYSQLLLMLFEQVLVQKEWIKWYVFCLSLVYVQFDSCLVCLTSARVID